MKVDVIYAMKQVIHKRVILIIGPSYTNPCGYVNGPVASKRFITVADACIGDIGDEGCDALFAIIF